jgi:hypothetical protein
VPSPSSTDPSRARACDGRVAALVAATIAVTAPAGLSAQVRDQPPTQLAYTFLGGFRYNPLGVILHFDGTHRLRLYEGHGDLTRQNFVGAGVHVAASPTWARVGPRIELQPLTILHLWASYELAGYFGTFDSLASFPSPRADFSDSAIGRRELAGATASYATTGTQFRLGATVQVKLGPIALRSVFQAVRGDFGLEREDRVYYDQSYDVLMPDGAFVLMNDADLLFVSEELVAGIRYTVAKPLYGAEHHASGEVPGGPGNHLQRLGPILIYRLATDVGTHFDQPSLILLVQWHLRHRYRTGADVSQALPYIGAAFMVTGDLLAD